MNFNEIFRVNVTYNIKSHKKSRVHPPSKNTISKKPQGRGQIDPPAFLGFKKDIQKLALTHTPFFTKSIVI